MSRTPPRKPEPDFMDTLRTALPGWKLVWYPDEFVPPGGMVAAEHPPLTPHKHRLGTRIGMSLIVYVTSGRVRIDGTGGHYGKTIYGFIAQCRKQKAEAQERIDEAWRNGDLVFEHRLDALEIR